MDRQEALGIVKAAAEEFAAQRAITTSSKSPVVLKVREALSVLSAPVPEGVPEVLYVEAPFGRMVHAWRTARPHRKHRYRFDGIVESTE